MRFFCHETGCSFRFPILLLLIVPAFLIGCGSDQIATYPTGGQVFFADGKPVKSGIIELESIDHGTTATGRITPEGTFTLGTYSQDDGAAAGKHRVIIIQVIMNDGSVKHTHDHGRKVPVKYGTYESSDLKTEVKAIEENRLVIQLSE